MLRRPAAVLLGLIVLAAGCGGCGGAAKHAPKDARDGGTNAGTGTDRAKREVAASQGLRPVISSGESLRVIDAYVARYNKAVAAADGRAWHGLLADPMATVAGARLRIRHGRPPDRFAITLVNPVLFVPRLDAFPKWFMVAAMERVGTHGKPHQALMIFTRSGPEAAWRLANKTITSATLPKIATDGQGYAVAVSAEQSPDRLAVPLGDLATAHAAYLTNVTTNVTTGINNRGTTGTGNTTGTFAAGPYTSEWRKEQAAWARRLRGGGWRDAVSFGQTRYLSAALRTKDGGVLAWYAVSRLDSLFSARASRRPDALPADVRGYLGRPPGGPRTEVRAAWLLLPLTYVPPAGGRPAVLGQTTGLTSAATIEH
jgi:voltage-gated potassium channel Kch